ncbi:hypothetical protein [Oscillatoria salina]|uniref:hypothetical protein n=1 Tax=Oscillatoria salina TaxID=331517 RepID=UPI0013BDA231|nr:hypothetical protein [Oscillatoria salina]MBZ8180266.1 hypothetical protein [Oscillatoria salina IIICB1]NET88944.1 hypothetical protein [Kamptonema sp. SIO1D9]
MNNREIKSLTDILAGLTAVELASRLNVEESFLEQIKEEANFSDWSKQQDPEAVSWRYDRVSCRYLVNLSFSEV